MDLVLTGREAGRRVIIGGLSPAINSLSPSVLTSGAVIGINQWGRDRPCSYAIALDAYRWHEWREWWDRLEAIRVMRAPNQAVPVEASIPDTAADVWFQSANPRIPTTWDGTLGWTSSTATAAINLAIVLGAAEVVLYGVDFVGNHRADGSEYQRPALWEAHREPINTWLRQAQQHITIYKTHPESWLECPYLEI